MPTTTNQSSNEVTLTYKYLLTFSTLSAVFFCYLYVTKPVAVSPTSSVPITETEADTHSDSSSSPKSFDSLGANSLPGEGSANSPTIESPASVNSSIPLAENDSTKGLVGFEETNDRVQHVLTAQNNNSSERIILEVPVIYRTRGLRFGPEQANEAQRVLRALKIYQTQIKKLHQDGKNIQSAWNSILMNSQPVEALRADSPSLPQTPDNHPSMLSENSSTTIKISE